MALSQDQFFEQYWPSTDGYQQLQGYANSKSILDGNKKRYPTGGEIARVEASLKNAWRQNSGFQQAWSSYSAQQNALLEAQRQQEELERQRIEAEKAAAELAAEQTRLQAQYKAEQEAISKQQLEQSAAINLQLDKERKAAEAEQAQLKTQFEAERVQTEKLVSQAQAETERQQIAAKRESAVALNVGKQAAFTKLRQAQDTQVKPQTQRKKTMIGQPGVTSTKLSARAGLGGYGGTAAGRINPTGLNI
jgi:chromosome segregation ATPase